MMALGREDTESQNRVVQHGGVQPLVRLLRRQRTSPEVILCVIRALASLCIGSYLKVYIISIYIIIYQLLYLFIFLTQFLCPENPEGTQVIKDSMSIGYDIYI